MSVIFSTLFFLLIACRVVSATQSTNVEYWHTEEMHVLNKACDENKPIVLALIGPECPWSQKIKEEILDQEAFVEKISPHTILWQYVFPVERNAQEEDMRRRFKIHTCPTILLLDPQGREFARFEYERMDASAFAVRLLDVI